MESTAIERTVVILVTNAYYFIAAVLIKLFSVSILLLVYAPESKMRHLTYGTSLAGHTILIAIPVFLFSFDNQPSQSYAPWLVLIYGSVLFNLFFG